MTCRINLKQCSYKQIPFILLSQDDFPQCEKIYKDYVRRNNIEHPYPIFEEEWNNDNIDILGYYDNDKLVAWSLIYKFPSKQTVVADQFAWNYENPKLKLGYKSIRSECAYYKSQSFNYFVLGDYDKYKQELQGFEMITQELHGIFST